MAEIGYTRGQTTFTAAEDLEKHRLVRVKSGSATTPVEVEYTDSGIVMGVTDESAKQGELVSIKPLNIEGTYEFEAATGSSISVGDAVFINTDTRDGRVTDTNTGYYVGQSADTAVANEIFEVGGVVGVIGAADAGDVEISDPFDYFTSDNVEGALGELGNTLNATGIQARQSILYTLKTDSSYDPLGTAENGGIISSDTTLIKLNADTDGAWRISADTTDVYLNTQAAMPPTFFCDATHPLVFGFNGYTDSTDWNIDYTLTFILDDGTVYQPGLASGTVSPSATPTDNDIISLTAVPDGINTANKALSASINMKLTNAVDPGVNLLHIYNLYFKFDRIVI